MTTQATKQQVRVPSVKTLMSGIVTPDGFEREETTGSNDHPNPEFRYEFPMLKLTSPDVRIEIHFTPDGPGRRSGYMLGDGHVSFDTEKGERTFDRYGVEDSFYIENPAKDYAQLWTGDRVVSGKTGRKGVITDQGYEKGKKVRPTAILWDGETEPETFTDRRLKAHGVEKSDVIDRANAVIRKIVEVKIPETRERLARSEKVPQIPFTVTPEAKAQIGAELKRGGYHRFAPSGFGTGYTLSAKRQPYANQSTVLARFFGVRSVYVSTFDAD